MSNNVILDAEHPISRADWRALLRFNRARKAPRPADDDPDDPPPGDAAPPLQLQAA